MRCAVAVEAAGVERPLYLLLEAYRISPGASPRECAEAGAAGGNIGGAVGTTAVQMETRSDLLLSTLRSYVEAMGGRLSLVAEFPDRPPVKLGGLGEVK